MKLCKSRTVMKLLNRKKAVFYFIGFIFLYSLIYSENLSAMDKEEVYAPLANFEFAVMIQGRKFTFTAESEDLYNVMMIPVIVIGNGERQVLTVTVSKTDSSGEVIAVMQYGTGAPVLSSNVGITPRSATIKPIFYWSGAAVICSAMLFSHEEGPFRYNVSISLGIF